MKKSLLPLFLISAALLPAARGMEYGFRTVIPATEVGFETVQRQFKRGDILDTISLMIKEKHLDPDDIKKKTSQVSKTFQSSVQKIINLGLPYKDIKENPTLIESVGNLVKGDLLRDKLTCEFLRDIPNELRITLLSNTYIANQIKEFYDIRYQDSWKSFATIFHEVSKKALDRRSSNPYSYSYSYDDNLIYSFFKTFFISEEEKFGTMSLMKLKPTMSSKMQKELIVPYVRMILGDSVDVQDDIYNKVKRKTKRIRDDFSEFSSDKTVDFSQFIIAMEMLHDRFSRMFYEYDMNKDAYYYSRTATLNIFDALTPNESNQKLTDDHYLPLELFFDRLNLITNEEFFNKEINTPEKLKQWIKEELKIFSQFKSSIISKEMGLSECIAVKNLFDSLKKCEYSYRELDPWRNFGWTYEQCPEDSLDALPNVSQYILKEFSKKDNEIAIRNYINFFSELYGPEFFQNIGETEQFIRILHGHESCYTAHSRSRLYIDQVMDRLRQPRITDEMDQLHPMLGRTIWDNISIDQNRNPLSVHRRTLPGQRERLPGEAHFAGFLVHSGEMKNNAVSLLEEIMSLIPRFTFPASQDHASIVQILVNKIKQYESQSQDLNQLYASAAIIILNKMGESSNYPSYNDYVKTITHNQYSLSQVFFLLDHYFNTFQGEKRNEKILWFTKWLGDAHLTYTQEGWSDSGMSLKEINKQKEEIFQGMKSGRHVQVSSSCAAGFIGRLFTELLPEYTNRQTPFVTKEQKEYALKDELAATAQKNLREASASLLKREATTLQELLNRFQQKASQEMRSLISSNPTMESIIQSEIQNTSHVFTEYMLEEELYRSLHQVAQEEKSKISRGTVEERINSIRPILHQKAREETRKDNPTIPSGLLERAAKQHVETYIDIILRPELEKSLPSSKSISSMEAQKKRPPAGRKFYHRPLYS